MYIITVFNWLHTLLVFFKGLHARSQFVERKTDKNGQKLLFSRLIWNICPWKAPNLVKMYFRKCTVCDFRACVSTITIKKAENVPKLNYHFLRFFWSIWSKRAFTYSLKPICFPNYVIRIPIYNRRTNKYRHMKSLPRRTNWKE